MDIILSEQEAVNKQGRKSSYAMTGAISKFTLRPANDKVAKMGCWC